MFHCVYLISLLRCHAMLSGRWVLKFHRKVLPPLSGHLHPNTAAPVSILAGIQSDAYSSHTGRLK